MKSICLALCGNLPISRLTYRGTGECLAWEFVNGVLKLERSLILKPKTKLKAIPMFWEKVICVDLFILPCPLNPSFSVTLNLTSVSDINKTTKHAHLFPPFPVHFIPFPYLFLIFLSLCPVCRWMNVHWETSWRWALTGRLLGRLWWITTTTLKWR